MIRQQIVHVDSCKICLFTTPRHVGHYGRHLREHVVMVTDQQQLRKFDGDTCLGGQ